MRAERNWEMHQQTLQNLREVAKTADNTVPAILDCVEAYATIGEISDVLREVFGEQQELTTTF